MAKPTNKKVQEFIDKIMMLDNAKYLILEKLRKIVFKIHPKTEERMMYGGIIFTLDNDFGGIFAYKNHVSFEFSYGYQFDDPENLLEGKGKFRRHLKIRSMDDVEKKTVLFFVKQIQKYG